MKETSIELINSPIKESTIGCKLHFRIILRAKEFKSVEELNKAAQDIPETAWEASFPSDLIKALDTASKRLDKLDHSRYGWLSPYEIEIINAVAIPYGDVRDIDPQSVTDNFIDFNNLKSLYLGKLSLLFL